jgi:predicted glycosyltransferase
MHGYEVEIESQSLPLRIDGDEVCPGIAKTRRHFVEKERNLEPMKIWIDLDNTPHVPFFKPIIRELERRGHSVVVTARDAFQVCEMAERLGVPCTKVGRHYGKNRFLKVWGLGWRSAQLLPFVMAERPALALSHGSRAQILLSNLLRIPTVLIMDYEHIQTPPLVRPRWEIVPDALLRESLHCKSKERIRTYPGIKEDVYATEFKPDPSLVQELQLNGEQIVATVRPPANEAHYHNPESDKLFVEFMNRVCETPGIKAVLLPRNKSQEAQMKESSPQWFKGSKVVIPKRAVDGLNLLWHSDLVVSGGGTMNREAAALGIPVYSIFRGKMGAVDRQLASEGRLTMIQTVDEVKKKISLKQRVKHSAPESRPRKALQEIIHHVEEILRTESRQAVRLATVPSPTNG